MLLQIFSFPICLSNPDCIMAASGMNDPGNRGSATIFNIGGGPGNRARSWNPPQKEEL